jgi:hypothetical protein
LKQHKPWIDKGCSELLYERKQAKLQWVQDPSEITGGHLCSVRCEVSRHCRTENREYLKDRINELATNSKNKNITDLYRGINEFKWVHQP